MEMFHQYNVFVYLFILGANTRKQSIVSWSSQISFILLWCSILSLHKRGNKVRLSKGMVYIDCKQVFCNSWGYNILIYILLHKVR